MGYLFDRYIVGPVAGYVIASLMFAGLLVAGMASLIIMGIVVGAVLLWFLGSMVKAILEYHGVLH